MKETPDLIDAGEDACITGIATKLQGFAGQKKPTPSMFQFKGTNVSVDIKVDPTSPYELKKENGKLHLYGGDVNFGEVWITKRPSYTPTLGLYCYYCFSMTFTRDYPRLIGRKTPAA